MSSDAALGGDTSSVSSSSDRVGGGCGDFSGAMSFSVGTGHADCK